MDFYCAFAVRCHEACILITIKKRNCDTVVSCSSDFPASLMICYIPGLAGLFNSNRLVLVPSTSQPVSSSASASYQSFGRRGGSLKKISLQVSLQVCQSKASCRNTSNPDTYNIIQSRCTATKTSD